MLSTTMRIANTLPQFNEKPALFILIGGKSLRAYRAAKGSIELIEEYLHTEPRYSDREGFFSGGTQGKARGGGGGGYAEKRVAQIEHDHFLNALKKRLAILWKDKVPLLYLFVAKHLTHDVESMMPSHVR